MITLSRIRSLVPSISDSDLMIADGFVAIRPELMPAVRAAVGNQVQYGRWLDQGYVMARVWVNPDEAVYVASQSACDLTPSTMVIGERVRPGPSVTTAANADDSRWFTVVGAERAEVSGALFRYMSTTYHYEMEGIKFWTLSCNVREAYGMRVGDEMIVGGSRTKGGFPGGDFISVSLARWPGTLRVKRPRPSTDIWPLIIGPAIFTRAEVYPFGSWCVVEASTLADRLQLAIEGITDATARAELTKQCTNLRSKGKDLLGWARFSQLDGLDLMPETIADASRIRSLDSGDVDGVPIVDVIARLSKQRGKRVPIVVSYFDPFDYDFSADLAVVPSAIALVVSSAGVVANNLDPLDLQSIEYWIDRVGSLKRVGVAVTVDVSPDLVDVYLSDQARQLVSVASSEPPPMDRYWSSTKGDRGAIGLGLWAAAVRPQRAEATELINVFTTPGFMDTLLPTAEA